ncbi:MAG: hypothetical protein JWN76_1456 [Chitinophagaceae bacterium]|nr:hypothetical protein [Chitinophagaceae bacterium]
MFVNDLVNYFMREKKLFAVILTVLGIVGLIAAAWYYVNAAGGRSTRAITVYGILGLIFFFAGLGLLRSTRDVL